jgi:hypothetical protein
LGRVSVGVDAEHARTLGGLLKGEAGVYYGLTCAYVVHAVGNSGVVEQPAHVDAAGSVIGTVAEPRSEGPRRLRPPGVRSSCRSTPMADTVLTLTRIESDIVRPLTVKLTTTSVKPGVCPVTTPLLVTVATITLRLV